MVKIRPPCRKDQHFFHQAFDNIRLALRPGAVNEVEAIKEAYNVPVEWRQLYNGGGDVHAGDNHKRPRPDPVYRAGPDWDHRGAVLRHNNRNGDKRMEIVRRLGFRLHPTDGHRHYYTTGKRQKITRYIPDENGVVQRRVKWVNVPPSKRTCRYCGYTEQEINRIKRKGVSPPEKAVGAQSETDPLEMAFQSAETIRKTKPGGLNNFDLICLNPDHTLKRITKRQGFCYAGIGTIAHKRAVLYFVDKAGCGTNWGINERYVRWLYEDSPFNLCLVNSVSHYMETRCTIQNTNLPGQYLIQAAMAFRYQYEYGKFVRDWGTLVDNGMDPAIAFLFCQSGTMWDGRYSWNGVTAHGHTIFDQAFKREGLRNYLSHNVQHIGYTYDEPSKLEPGYRNMNYSGLVRAWQGKAITKDLTIVLPEGKVEVIKDSLDRDKTVYGNACGTREEVLALQDLFLKSNEVDYEPKESVHCERRPSVCQDVPVSRVESAASGHIKF